jgi:hypothetical protein
MRFARPLAVGVALALGVLGAGMASAECPAVPVRDLVSGVLEGRRVSSLTCVVINKSGAPVDNIAISLKRPDGTTLVGPEECDGVPHGQVCSLTYDIVFPDLDVAAYCHAQVPDGPFLVGNLRFQNYLSATLAESPLVGDLHGQIEDLIGQVEWLLGHDACVGDC